MKKSLRAPALAAFLVACGQSGVCPPLPTSCQNPIPSWDGGVSQIVATRCAACHFAGSALTPFPLDSYSNVYAYRGPALNQVYACLMPNQDGGVPLTQNQRAALVDWFECGAPNN